MRPGAEGVGVGVSVGRGKRIVEGVSPGMSVDVGDDKLGAEKATVAPGVASGGGSGLGPESRDTSIGAAWEATSLATDGAADDAVGVSTGAGRARVVAGIVLTGGVT